MLAALGFTPYDTCAVCPGAEMEDFRRPDCCLQGCRNTTENILSVGAVLMIAVLCTRTGNGFKLS